MIKSLIRGASRLVGCTALVLAVSAPVQGVQVTLPPLVLQVQILGADAACPGGFTAGGSPTAPTLTCITGGGGGGGVPTGCSIVGPTSATANQSITLTSSCSGGGAATGWSWTGGNCQGSGQSCVATQGSAGTVTYGVTPSNSSGAATSPASPQTLSVTWGSGGGGGGGGLANCTALGYNVIGGNALTLPFTQSQGGSSGNFGDTNVWVFQLTVPAGTPDTNFNGSLLVAEAGSQPTFRHMVISKVACDFNNPVDYTGANGPVGASRNNSTASVSFQVGAPAFSGIPRIQAGQTYYISVRNWSDFINYPNGGPDCGGSCSAAYQYQPTH